MLQSTGFGMEGQVVKGLGHSVQAEFGQAVAGGVSEHVVSQWK